MDELKARVQKLERESEQHRQANMTLARLIDMHKVLLDGTIDATQILFKHVAAADQELKAKVTEFANQ